MFAASTPIKGAITEPDDKLPISDVSSAIGSKICVQTGVEAWIDLEKSAERAKVKVA